MALTRKHIEDEHLVARYARGSLSEQQREAFEDYCVLHPDVAEQVSTDRALIAGMRGLQDGSRVEARAKPTWNWAMAASIVAILLVAGAWFSFRAGSGAVLYATNDRALHSMAARLGEPMRVVQTRGTGMVLGVSPPRDVLELHIVLSSPPAPGAMTVTLTQQTPDGDVVQGPLNVSPAQLDGEWIVSVALDTSALTGNNLRLDVDQNGARESFRVRVLRRP